MAEGARLESVFTRKGNVGSNPTLSARLHFGSQNCGFRKFVDPLKPFFLEFQTATARIPPNFSIDA